MAGTLTLTVAERMEDRGNIARIKFVGDDLPTFTAGAHLDLYLPEVDMWRQYSLCSDPVETDHYEIGVLKDPNSRGGSEAVHRLAWPGTTFQAEQPRNHFPLIEDAKTTILFGGGIGITPMVAMARRLHALGHHFTLHYCTKSESVTAFYGELKDAPFADRVVFHFDDQDVAQRLDLDRDLPALDKGTHLYVCGPQGFMDWVIGMAEAKGHKNVHREYFSANVEPAGDSFEVEARTSGITVTVGSNDTIAKALNAAGVKVTVKCEEGVCGTCVTDVLEGEIDHRDHFLTAEEREEGELICVCCSRAKGKLILDI